MGSPQYGELILDGEPMAKAIECESLTWSADRRVLAAQQFVSDVDGPRTRIILFDAEGRIELVSTPPVDGLCNPVRFEGDTLVYTHWHHSRGERELRLPLPTA
jgi:hypothetical protein